MILPAKPATWSVSRLSARHLIAHVLLGVFILSIPVCYLDASGDRAWITQPLGILTVLAHFPELRLRQLHLSVIVLAGIWLFFAFTAFDTGYIYVTSSFAVFGKFVALALLLSVTVRERSQIITVMGALALSAIFVTIMSRAELGESRQLVDEVATSRVGTARTSGVFANSNVFGTYAILSGIAAVMVASYTRRAGVLMCSLPALACSAYLALHSGSRKALLGMALLCLYALRQIFQERTSRRNRLLTVILAVLVIAGAGTWFQANRFAVRFSTTEASFVVRDNLLHAALSMWQKAPLLGSGYRAFELNDIAGAYTHSTPFEMLVSGGVIACGLYLLLFGSTFRSLIVGLRDENDPREKTILYGMTYLWLTLFVFSLFTVILEERLFLALCGVLCGYLGNKDHQRRTALMTRGWRTHANPV